MHWRSPALPPSGESLPTPDVSFRLALGVYAAALFAPALAAVAAGALTPGPAGTYVVFVGVTTLVLVGVGVAAGRVRGIAERIGAGPVSWALPLGGLLASAAYVAVTFADGLISGTLTALGAFTAGLGVLIGLLVRRMARSRYAAVLVADAETVAEWTAGWPKRRRLRVGVVAAALVFFGLTAFIGGVLPGGAVVEAVGAVAYVVGVGLIGTGNERTYRVTERGLERSNQFGRWLIDWNDVVGVGTTDTELLIRRRQWYRPAIRCSLDDIDDAEAARDALRRYTPRTQETDDGPGSQR